MLSVDSLIVSPYQNIQNQLSVTTQSNTKKYEIFSTTKEKAIIILPQRAILRYKHNIQTIKHILINKTPIHLSKKKIESVFSI